VTPALKHLTLDSEEVKAVTGNVLMSVLAVTLDSREPSELLRTLGNVWRGGDFGRCPACRRLLHHHDRDGDPRGEKSAE